MDDVKEREAYIAGDLKREDWHKRRVELRDKPSPELWAETFDKFLMRRLKDRYLEPIQAIQEAGALKVRALQSYPFNARSLSSLQL